MIKGLPASGKTTKAGEIVSQGNWVRVNRDLIRTMLHFDKFTPRNEGKTVDAEKALVRYFLSKDVNVVVDDCNLNPKNNEIWGGIAHECGAKFETHTMRTAWHTCVARDATRTDKDPVGKDVIKNMAIQYGLITFKTNSVVICDIDGTVADLTHRLRHLKEDPKDWKSFFADTYLDTVLHRNREVLIDFYNKGKAIIFVTGRPDDTKDTTIKWLDDNGMSFGFTLIMRRSGDHRPDDEVKEQILNTYFPDKHVIHKVIDDRPSVIRMWKRNGLDVLDVGDGVEF